MPRKTTKEPCLIILATGGTGRHLYPAEAVCAHLQKMGMVMKLYTDHRPIPNDGLLASLQTRRFLSAGITGKGLFTKIKAAILLGLGSMQAVFAMARDRPNLVIGFGGYSSIPTILAAKLWRVPYIIHEQNAVLGRANRLVASGAQALALSFTRTDKLSAAQRIKSQWVGNPVRQAITALTHSSYQLPQKGQKLSILITGGSQGASIYTKILPDALTLLTDDSRSMLRLVQQARLEDIETLSAAYQALNLDFEVKGFFDDMPKRLEQAHLVIARAGASTIAELTLAGKPAILVPYPFATDDHQTANAVRISEIAGGWMIPQQDFTPEWLAARLQNFIDSEEILPLAAKAVRKHAMPDAALKLAAMAKSVILSSGNNMNDHSI
ncbi:MAG: undecaprenyldiphospho-muramoylpentapeptide beta-N-acetylglucosaminyltransferase [Alphaproteobacteria bacterium]